MKRHDGKLSIESHFTSSHSDLNEMLNWTKRKASIKSANSTVVFEQDNVEFPTFWSDTAVAVVSDKYFRGIQDTEDREDSLKELGERVIKTTADWGIELGYFDEDSAKAFSLDMYYLIYNQYCAFNSPVWFNVGIEECPQASACFIQGVEDDMISIMDLAHNEAMIFKGGSGSGTNFSNIRSKNENLSGGGHASGPVSFMRGLDSFAGAIKSGGRNRRAAKLTALNIGHPDVMEFIESKHIEEGKAAALIEAGYNADFNDEFGAYSSIAFQNENHSVGIKDAFMRRVKEDGDWSFYTVVGREFIKKMRARDIFMKLCECAHACGDPGVLFLDTINAYHTTPSTGDIKSSNPCGEFLDMDDSACNLASLNLMRFISRTKDGFIFDVDSFVAAIELIILAQEIFVDKASYPTERITNNTKSHRPLGLGYCNLGTLLMYCGLPYDSVNGRALASSITSLMTATAYRVSATIASVKGAFDVYEDNEEAFLMVMSKHHKNCENIQKTGEENIDSISKYAYDMWGRAINKLNKYGSRNSKVTLLAPTGTIGIMMDADTTGMEPDTAIIKTKTMVGGGSIKMVNKTIGHALHNLGYSNNDTTKILDYIHENEELENCRILNKEHLPIFDCALGTSNTSRIIKSEGHVKMLAAIQPHISGGISKTVNMSSNTTPQDVFDIFMLAYDIGVKCITIYRDGSKSSQPLNVKQKETTKKTTELKRRMPDERKSITHKFSISGTYKGYLTVGFFNDGNVGEIFLQSSKAGSTMNGLLDSFATMVSISLQNGVPLTKIINKFSHVSFEPSGFTTNPEIGLARSIVDYVARYLLKFVKDEEIVNDSDADIKNTFSSDAPPCTNCGAIMIRSGSCYLCRSCGASGGCS